MKQVSTIIVFLFVFLDAKCSMSDSLLIRYSDWDIETTNISTCSNFERVNGYDKEFLISQPLYIDSLKNLLTHVQVTEDDYFCVRCKLYIFEGDTVKQRICMNKTHIAFNGKTYANNDSIRTYLSYLMQIQTPTSFERFWPEIMGADYIGGKDALYQLLTSKTDEITRQMNYTKTIIMNIACKADKSGNTIDAEVKIVKPQIQTETEKTIASKIREYLITSIYWQEDLDRTPYDTIYFPFRYTNDK